MCRMTLVYAAPRERKSQQELEVLPFYFILFYFEIFNYYYSENRDKEKYTGVNVFHNTLFRKKKQHRKNQDDYI